MHAKPGMNVAANGMEGTTQCTRYDGGASSAPTHCSGSVYTDEHARLIFVAWAAISVLFGGAGGAHPMPIGRAMARRATHGGCGGTRSIRRHDRNRPRWAAQDGGKLCEAET
jgi:hypothetical protein